jgi:endonuclease/exonuclease/phosphatase family metal-dependent hydrolase
LIRAAVPTDPPRFRVATYNVENYLLEPVGTRPAKSPGARQAVRSMIRRLDADILALQEIGGRAALEELREALRGEGLPYAHARLAWGHDTNIAVAVLSRFPITADRSLTNASFLLLGRRHFVNRAFVELDIQVTPDYALTLMAAHLKSRRTAIEADEAELREQEAILLRARVDARLARDPAANLVVLGDLNDTRDSRPVRTLLGRAGPRALVDTRPCECGETPAPVASRAVTWTHFYAKEDTYSRIDYLLLSRGMAEDWVRGASCVVRAPEWGAASDHRPVVATFVAHSPRRFR